MLKDAIYCSIIVVLIVFIFRGCNNEQSLQSRLDVSDSLLIMKNKDGSEVATEQAIVEDVANLKKSTPKTDTDRRLKETAKDYGNNLNASVSLNESTQESIGGKPTIDTTKIPSIDSITPQNRLDGIVYRKQFNTDWRQMDVYASKDTIWINYRIVNKMDISFKYQKLGLKEAFLHPGEIFKPRNINAFVKNLNPNTGVVQESAFVKRERKHYTLAKIGIGVVLVEIGKGVVKGFLGK